MASGNPDLQPFESLNLDATLEYYLSTGGLLSVGGFYKRVDNPIYEFEVTERDTEYQGRFYEEITFEQDRNADVGTIRGLEASYQQAGFELRMALSYQSEVLQSVGSEAFTDEYEDDRLAIDLSGSYTFWQDRLEAQVQIQNLTNETERRFQDIERRTLADIETGRTVTIGVAANF